MGRIKFVVKSLAKSPVIIIFVLICIFMLPSAINTMSVAFRSAIAVAVGIDMNEKEEVELYVSISVSSTAESLTENSKVLSATGRTVGDAFTSLNTIFGRSIKLQHTRFVMVGRRISQDNLAKALDRLVRTSKMRNTVQLVFCPDDVGEMFNVGTQLKKATGIKLSEIVTHQQNDSTTSISSNIDAFYKGYFNPSKISLVNSISLSEDYTQGISATNDLGSSDDSSSQSGGAGQGGGSSGSSGQGGGSGQGGSSGSSGQGGESQSSSKKYISNLGELAVFKDGKLETVLNREQSNGVNWLSNDYNPKDLFVKVKNAKNLKDATINFDILNKKVIVETFFYKNIPFLSAQIVVSLDLDEVISENEKVEIEPDVVDEVVKSAVGKTIRDQISNVSKLSKDLNLDLFKLNNIFHKRNYKEYMEYIKSGHTEQDFLQYAQVSADISIKII